MRRNEAFFRGGGGPSEHFHLLLFILTRCLDSFAGPPAAASSKSVKAALLSALKRARATGRLQLSQASLSSVPPELFSLTDTLEAGENWWECFEISSVDVSMNEITALPPKIRCRMQALHESHRIFIILLVNVQYAWRSADDLESVAQQAR